MKNVFKSIIFTRNYAFKIKILERWEKGTGGQIGKS